MRVSDDSRVRAALLQKRVLLEYSADNGLAFVVLNYLGRKYHVRLDRQKDIWGCTCPHEAYRKAGKGREKENPCWHISVCQEWIKIKRGERSWTMT